MKGSLNVVTDDGTQELNLGEYIKYLRERANLTQKQLADSTAGKVHPQLISNIERGMSLPSDDFCLSLALYFNLSDKHELLTRKIVQKIPEEARYKIAGLQGPERRRIQILNSKYCRIDAMVSATDFPHEAVASGFIFSDVKDHKAFGLIAGDSSNHPKIEEGDTIIFGPTTPLVHGDFCCVLHKDHFRIRVFQIDSGGILFRCYDPTRSIEFYDREKYKAMTDQGALRVFPVLAVIKIGRAHV